MCGNCAFDAELTAIEVHFALTPLIWVMSAFASWCKWIYFAVLCSK